MPRRLTAPRGIATVSCVRVAANSDLAVVLDEILLAMGRAHPREVNRHIERFHRLVGARCVDLIRHFLRRSALAADAEDIYQEFVMSLPEKAATFQSRSDHSAWAWTRQVLIRRAISKGRTRKGERLVGDVAERELPAPPSRTGDDLPELADWQKVIAETVARARARDRTDLEKRLSILRDCELEHVDTAELAIKYFGKNTPENRNKIAQYAKRGRTALQATWSAMSLAEGRRGEP